MTDFFSDVEARELCHRTLVLSGADGAEVRLSSGLAGFTRFARNQITTSGDTVNAQASVRAVYGQRSASVTLNDLSDAGIRRAVADSEELAKLAPEDPEHMELLGPQQYLETHSYFERTHGLSPAERVDAVLSVAEPAAAAELVATGFLQLAAGSSAVANTNGLYVYHRSTLTSYTTTVRTLDGTGSGWAGTTHNDWGRTTPAGELAERAIGKARGSANAAAIEPGPYTVVLEPTAVGNLVRLLRSALDARSVDEGRSFFSKQRGGNPIGERVVDEGLTLRSDPADPDLLARPFTDEGQPVSSTTWIENGVLTNLAYSRYWAARQGRDALPFAGGIKLTGGDGTVDDLIGTVQQGLLVTRFWYIRVVDRRTMLYTGLTRDGTFLIENGQVTRAVRNLRFNESPFSMLNNIEAVGSAVRVVASESGGAGAPVVVPPLVVRDFHFTSVSDAV